jgi:hypothetical protein
MAVAQIPGDVVYKIISDSAILSLQFRSFFRCMHEPTVWLPAAQQVSY